MIGGKMWNAIPVELVKRLREWMAPEELAARSATLLFFYSEFLFGHKKL